MWMQLAIQEVFRHPQQMVIHGVRLDNIDIQKPIPLINNNIKIGELNI
jgi:hypothetical protein